MKLLYTNNTHSIYARGYRLIAISHSGERKAIGSLRDPINSVFSAFRITRRFFRAEIIKFYILQDGTQLCIARKGLFRKAKEEKNFSKCFAIPRGSRPMNICEASDGTLYFGEYFANMEKKAVHIYSSEDSGKNWKITYTFPEGNINHVHGIYRDPYTDRLWFITGDRENECIIGYSEDGFMSMKEVFRGGQDYRSCVLFFYPAFIVFATDSQYQKNYIKKFDRKTLEITTLASVQGPVIKGAQCGNLSVISTDVEPSDINKDNKAYIWYSKDGLEWKELYSAEKDILNPTLFQFGVFDLPIYDCEKTDTIYATGKSLKKCDGKTLIFKI